jgi:hypothetical protein
MTGQRVWRLYIACNGRTRGANLMVGHMVSMPSAEAGRYTFT